MSTGYVAVVRVGNEHQVPADQLLSTLDEYDPALGTSSDEWLEVRINLLADDLAQACKSALALVAAATGARAMACKVMTESEFGRRYRFSSATQRDRFQDDPPRFAVRENSHEC